MTDLINATELYEKLLTKTLLRVTDGGGQAIDPRAKWFTVTYTNGDKTVTYRFYEDNSLAVLYNTITTNFSKKQNTDLLSGSWS